MADCPGSGFKVSEKWSVSISESHGRCAECGVSVLVTDDGLASDHELTVRLVICRPRADSQTLQTYHVHAEKCTDLRRYGPNRPLGGSVEAARDFTGRSAIVRSEYPEEQYPEDWKGLIQNFKIFPCCGRIPKED